MARALRTFAEHHGHAQKFHLTMTLCWTRFVAAAISEEPDCSTCDELLLRHPALCDKRLPLRYYSQARLFSDEARRSWVDPDLQPLPQTGVCSDNP